MSSPPADLEKLAEKYPCDQRDGYGVLKKCKCRDENGEYKVEKRMIRCKLKDKNLMWVECTCCPYQKELVRKKD